MFTLIKPGTNIDFIGRHKYGLALSGTLITASLVSLLVLGLNLGIDFKGGTSLIVSFKGDTPVDRGAIADAIGTVGEVGAQVEVQDFDLGDTGAIEGGTRRFQIYTELTSLLTTERVQELKSSIRERFGEETLVETPEEGGDVFYLAFEEAASIVERTQGLTEVFTALGYENVQVVSEREREMDMDYIRELNLYSSELLGDEGEDALPESLRRSVFEERKEERLADMSDIRFTVTVEELKAEFEAVLAERFPDQFLSVDSSTSISASVGRDLLADGLIAILYALLGMLLYITLRFDLRFAPGAVAALVHDVIITLGIFSLFQIRFSLPIVAALLTIVGYSLNDTIVLFDRVRENADRLRGRAFSFVVNAGINGTLSRTVLTSMTTLMVVGSILLLGGGLIRDFAFALFIGVLVGTYSSIFVAAPMAIFMEQLLTKRAAARKATAES